MLYHRFRDEGHEAKGVDDMNWRNLTRFVMLGIIVCLICLLLSGMFRVESVAHPCPVQTEGIICKCDIESMETKEETEAPFMPISEDDRHTIECVVQGESGNESLEGKMWVATCLLNAMRNSDIDAETARVSGQYAGWNENVSEETKIAVSMVFDGGKVTHDSVLWFYAPRWCESNWHESQQFVAEIGSHRFFAPHQ